MAEQFRDNLLENCRWLFDMNVLREKFKVVYEGALKSWPFTCDTSLERVGSSIDLLIVCDTKSTDPLTEQILGEEVQFEEVGNVATDSTWSGALGVTSSRGWTTNGAGSLRWTGWENVTGTVSVNALNLDVDGSLGVTYSVD